MTEVRNLNKKRIGDMSSDQRLFEIQIKDCVTSSPSVKRRSAACAVAG